MIRGHEGYLEKRVRQRIGSAKWRRKYFEFDAPYLIVRDAPGKKEKARFLLTHKADLVNSTIGGPKHPFCFGLSLDMAAPQTETLFCNCESEAERKEWSGFLLAAIVALRDRDMTKDSSQTKVIRKRVYSRCRVALTNVPKETTKTIKRESVANMSGEADEHNPYDGTLKRPQLWAWGSNVSGQLGQTISLCQNTATPMLVEALKRKNQPVFSVCGEAHTVAITGQGSMFAFGKGDRGQLGVGSKVLKTTRPYLMKGTGKRRGVAVTSGWNHNLVITDDGDVLGWGDGANGCLGLGERDESEPNTYMDPVPIPHLGISNGIAVSRIATGGQHSAFVSLAGSLYMCGLNSHGQLGLGHLTTVYTPELVTSLASRRDEHSDLEVVDVACGECFTIVSMKGRAGRIFQAGFVGVPNYSPPPGEESLGYAQSSPHPTFTKVDLPLSEDGDDAEIVLSIAAGWYHAGALLGLNEKTGGAKSVYTWGENVHGALGHGNDDERLDAPHEVEAMVQIGRDVSLAQLSMGKEFSAVLTMRDDRVYTWGKGSEGQLGHGAYVDATLPVLVRRPQKTGFGNLSVHFVSICCGKSHMTGLTSEGLPRYDSAEDDRTAAMPQSRHTAAVTKQMSGILGGIGKYIAKDKSKRESQPMLRGHHQRSETVGIAAGSTEYGGVASGAAGRERSGSTGSLGPRERRRSLPTTRSGSTIHFSADRKAYKHNQQTNTTKWLAKEEVAEVLEIAKQKRNLNQAPKAPEASKAAPAAAAAPGVVVESWEYSDSSGNVQGPFPAEHMQHWYAADQIHWNLQCRDATKPNEPFVEIVQLFPDKATAFTVPPERVASGGGVIEVTAQPEAAPQKRVSTHVDSASGRSYSYNLETGETKWLD
jgi:alpha-tubulin suppressor-like RCC1 family protein